MLELPIERATVKTVNGHQYHVFFPTPPTHKNQDNRPSTYADENSATVYKGKGSNNAAKLLPEVHDAANALMSALTRYGERINDWSMKSAVIASGWRADNAAQGAKYLEIIKRTIKNLPEVFGTLEFPSTLEADAQGVLGPPGDARRRAFHQRVAASPGWDATLTAKLFKVVDGVYAPRGSNPHTTGLVFDLNFDILDGKQEKSLDAATALNSAALRTAAGMWLNTYSMQFGFDSYDTGKEIWHMEWRNPKEGPGSPQAINLLNCCSSTLEIADDLLKQGEQAIRDAIRRVPL
jgi:hypothetical protein